MSPASIIIAPASICAFGCSTSAGELSSGPLISFNPAPARPSPDISARNLDPQSTPSPGFTHLPDKIVFPDVGEYVTLVPMKHTYIRKIRFADTDAAGVTYFANYLSICHEAYEDSLDQAGIELQRFFSAESIIIPISNARIDYLRPMQCGTSVEVEVVPQQVKEDTFFVDYQMFFSGTARKIAAKARTAHVCLDAITRRRSPLPEQLRQWLQAD